MVGLGGGAPDPHRQVAGLAGLEVDAPDFLGLEAELAEEEVEALAAPVVDAGLVGLEVEAPDSLGLEAELAAEEGEAPAAPVVDAGLVGLEVEAPDSLGLEAELVLLEVEWELVSGKAFQLC